MRRPHNYPYYPLQVYVLANSEDLKTLSNIIFRESTTIGLRYSLMDRVVLNRKSVSVNTPYGKMGVKISGMGDMVLNYTPEFEDCQRAALIHKVPIKEVYWNTMNKCRELDLSMTMKNDMVD